MIVTELATLSAFSRAHLRMRANASTAVLSLLWLATSADATFQFVYEGYPVPAPQIFLVISWFTLALRASLPFSCATPSLICLAKVTGYTTTIFASAVARSRRGERTWTISVKHARFFDPRSRAKPGAAPFDTVLMQPFQLPQAASTGGDSALHV